MANSFFEFKQFTIQQDSCAMKIGTDAVLLGAWSSFDKENGNCRILDIGTGTGILAIMAAQKNPTATVDAVEIDHEAFLQAKENIGNSPWKDNIHIAECDVSDFFTTQKYDFIVSNPPYFEKSLKSPDVQRSVARHTDTLSFDKLASSIKRLLNDEGKAYIILPAEAEDSMCSAAINHNLYLSHKANIITKDGQKAKRVIIVLRHNTSTYTEENITVRNSDGSYTEQYVKMTADFYVKL